MIIPATTIPAIAAPLSTERVSFSCVVAVEPPKPLEPPPIELAVGTFGEIESVLGATDCVFPGSSIERSASPWLLPLPENPASGVARTRILAAKVEEAQPKEYRVEAASKSCGKAYWTQCGSAEPL